METYESTIIARRCNYSHLDCILLITNMRSLELQVCKTLQSAIFLIKEATYFFTDERRQIVTFSTDWRTRPLFPGILVFRSTHTHTHTYTVGNVQINMPCYTRSCFSSTLHSFPMKRTKSPVASVQLGGIIFFLCSARLTRPNVFPIE